MNIKIILRYHFLSSNWQKSKHLTTNSAGESVRKQASLYMTGRNAKDYIWQFLAKLHIHSPFKP